MIKEEWKGDGSIDGEDIIDIRQIRVKRRTADVRGRRAWGQGWNSFLKFS